MLSDINRTDRSKGSGTLTSRLPSIASDLSGFSAIPLRQNQEYRACRQQVRLAISDDGSDGFNAMKS